MITLQDMIDSFGENELAELTDRKNYTTINQVVINKAIDAAISEAMGYLNPTGLIVGGVYVHTPPKSLVLKVCDIARYYLYENAVIDIVDKRYTQAIKWLQLVQENPKMLTGEQDDNHGLNRGIAVIPNPTPDMWKIG